MDLEYFRKKKEKAKLIYDRQREVVNPYLNSKVVFNSDGFHHLQFSDRREREKEEQLLKFNLLPPAIDVVKKSGTLQEYRREPVKIGKPSKRDGLFLTKIAEYFGFVAIVGETKIKIRVIVRRIGDGNFTFWSVMPDSKLKGGQKLYDSGIEDE